MAKRSNKLTLEAKSNKDSKERVSDSSPFLPKGLIICDLKKRVDCLEEVALWHHHEWLRTSEQAIDVTAFGDKLDQRIDLLKSHLDQPGIPFTLLAELSGNVIGTVSLVQYTFMKTDVPSEWLTNLFVLPEYRGKKVGSCLLENAERLAKKQHVQLLKLYTHDQREFYQQREWHVMGNARIQQRDVTILAKKMC